MMFSSTREQILRNLHNATNLNLFENYAIDLQPYRLRVTEQSYPQPDYVLDKMVGWRGW